MQAKLLFVHALSPLHAGTGQGVGVIDLPIVREKATGIPFLPGTSVKGVLRDACMDDNKVAVFGPDTNNASKHAGSAQFTDARLLLLPVRSLAGTFAWVTSPLLLQRFLRDARDSEDVHPPTNVPAPPADTQCVVAGAGCQLLLAHRGTETVVLEDLALSPVKSGDAETWAGWLGTHLFPGDAYWSSAVAAHLCIVHDDVLSFLLQTATEITARIKLESDKKTVANGALWYEEALPAETVLTGLVIAAPVEAEAAQVFDTVDALTQSVLQFGGNATVGRGLCRLRLV